MTTIHVINAGNRHAYADVMQAYYRKCYEVFVEGKGRKDLDRSDGLEIDQFDNLYATYLLALEGDKVVAGSRFYPTVRPHMISEAFMYLVDRPLPRNSMTLEWSRYFVSRDRRVGRTECRLLAGVQQYCLEEGITALTCLQDMWWVPRWQQLGIKVRPLGLPRLVDDQPTMAVCIDVSETSLASVRALGGLKAAKLTRRMIDQPQAGKVADAA